ncbi:MAG: LysM peptidoglycan-binding domain-containing protein [Blautia sp.]|uniref:LysM peptidoglycan-binding domain-containing protein n=1 Tax=Blautia sp. TaxID=1955243 RepID=UPI002E77263E|nr:LysM peptidoglycan-binding domain-containing protein [Blautia sp.]MEE1442011.1 LysM peptidoglycan-binding domain-containing protein [Blautia sp.]
MIEIVYEKEKQKPEGNEEFFRIPNNIRQIGEIEGTQKIYIEDYAYTYLCRISSENPRKGIAAILLGQANWKEGTSYLFVKSAVALSDMEVSEEHVDFTQETWNHVYEKNKEYFPEQEIVGWFLSVPGCSMELHEVICQTHLDHFGGNDKVLFVMEPLEKEEAFYRYEDGKMSRQTGFYVYYEKNEAMRNFLIAQNERLEKKSEEVDDGAVHSFREKVEKKAEQENQKKHIPLFKTASVCVAAAALAVGVLYLNDYQKLRGTEKVIASLEEQGQKKETEKPEAVTPVNAPVKEEKETELSQKTPEDEMQEEQPEKTSKEEPVENAKEPKEETATATHTSYTIQPGDTMTRISIKNYGTIKKIKEICELNQMSENDTIYPGQKILLP